MNASIKDLGVKDLENSAAQFEKLFRTTADAAEIILRGVQKNKRRILVGNDARAYDLLQRVLPGRYPWLIVQASRVLL